MSTILVVEDNPMNLELITRRLKKKGFQVESATDGEKGLEAIRSLKPDLVLLDMSLPEKDGWTVAQDVKADPEIQHIPLIALTAHAMQGDRDKAIDAGCDEYETKPIEFEKLLGKIEKLLPIAA